MSTRNKKLQNHHVTPMQCHLLFRFVEEISTMRNHARERLKKKLTTKQQTRDHAHDQAVLHQLAQVGTMTDIGLVANLTFGDPHFLLLPIYKKCINWTLDDYFQTSEFQESVMQHARQVAIEKSGLLWDDVLVYPYVDDMSSTSLKIWMETGRDKPHQIIVPLVAQDPSSRIILCQKIASLEKHREDVDVLAAAIEGSTKDKDKTHTVPEGRKSELEELINSLSQKIDALESALKSTNTELTEVRQKLKSTNTELELTKLSMKKRIDVQDRTINDQGTSISWLMKNHGRAQDVALRGMVECWKGKVEAHHGRMEGEKEGPFLRRLPPSEDDIRYFYYTPTYS